MKIEVFSDPNLLDYIIVCAKMPADERAQLEAFTGQPYDVDGAAIGNFTAPGPKWVIKADGNPIAIGGFVQQRPGVWRDFMLTTPEAWEHHWFTVTRVARRIMDAMFKSGQAHRLECMAPANRVSSREKLAKWYKVLGYNYEGLHHGYCADGSDAVSYSRVKH